MLQEEALLIAEKLGIRGFTASNGWLQRFKQRYNLQKMAIAGEDVDVSKETLESWNERVREITRGWSPENVWNMDETGSFWRGLPDTRLNEKGRRCRGVKQAKQRHTWAFFVNAAGEKEDPIVIGTYAKPPCFNNLKDIKRPYGCWYYANPKAWMNTEIMKDVLARLNEKLKRKKRNILPIAFQTSVLSFFPKTQRQRRSPLTLASLQTGRSSTRRSFYDMFALRLTT